MSFGGLYLLARKLETKIGCENTSNIFSFQAALIDTICFLHGIRVSLKCSAFEEITLQGVPNSSIHAKGGSANWGILGQVVNDVSVCSYA